VNLGPHFARRHALARDPPTADQASRGDQRRHGLAVSFVGIRLFDQATRTWAALLDQFAMDRSVFAYLAAICLGTGVLFGLAPALLSRDRRERSAQGRRTFGHRGVRPPMDRR
jgi:hypothetical protein